MLELLLRLRKGDLGMHECTLKAERGVNVDQEAVQEAVKIHVQKDLWQGD